MFQLFLFAYNLSQFLLHFSILVVVMFHPLQGKILFWNFTFFVGIVRASGDFFVPQVNLGPGRPSHRIVSDNLICLFVTLSYFCPVRFVQLLSLLPILILLLFFLVSADIIYTGILARLEERRKQLI